MCSIYENIHKNYFCISCTKCIFKYKANKHNLFLKYCFIVKKVSDSITWLIVNLPSFDYFYRVSLGSNGGVSNRIPWT